MRLKRVAGTLLSVDRRTLIRVKPGPPAIGAPLPPFSAAIRAVRPVFVFNPRAAGLQGLCL